MATRNLPKPELFEGYTLEPGIKLDGFFRGGKNGLVYRATQTIAGHGRPVAVKVIPHANVRAGWHEEIRKPHLLAQSIKVVRPERVQTITLPGETASYVFIVMPWIEGYDLRQYVELFPQSVTNSFCVRIGEELLSLLFALEARHISHGDIHDRNILIEVPGDDRVEPMEEFWLTDFGIGNSLNSLTPKDDYVSVGEVLQSLTPVARRNTASGSGRFECDQMEEWLIPRLREGNPSNPLYRNAQGLLTGFRECLRQPPTRSQRSANLDDPFDYMSCEQMGQQHVLLQSLLKMNFPNAPDFLEKGNTVLTGPRGCGKTMLLRSLASKSRVLGGAEEASELNLFGIYYHCTDLFYAFPYSSTSEVDRHFLEGTLHYFNLSLLAETLTSIDQIAMSQTEVELKSPVVRNIVSWTVSRLPNIRNREKNPTSLADIRAQVDSARLTTKLAMQRGSVMDVPALGLDFVPEMLAAFTNAVPWLEGLSSFVFLDDYSTPRVSEQLQASLNRAIFQRWDTVFFKVATEHITSLHPHDSSGKLLEPDREYSVMDLGASFMTAEADSRRQFISDVVNTRFHAVKRQSLPSLEVLLGDGELAYNEMARQLRSPQQLKYRGLDVIVDMCSGDITHTLRLIRDIVAGVGGIAKIADAKPRDLPVDASIQNRAIMKLGADFLSNIEAAPSHGPLIRKIADSFGEVAHWELMNLDSPNQGSTPPKQAFRIELRDALEFDDSEAKLKQVYEALLRYGVFIRDSTGRSLRSATVDRLYLRRLLIPICRLTFSRRDNVGMEVREFKRLLSDPEGFKNQALKKRREKKNANVPRLNFRDQEET